MGFCEPPVLLFPRFYYTSSVFRPQKREGSAAIAPGAASGRRRLEEVGGVSDQAGRDQVRPGQGAGEAGMVVSRRESTPAASAAFAHDGLTA